MGLGFSRFLLYCFKLAPTDPWCKMLRDFTWTKIIWGGSVRWTPSKKPTYCQLLTSFRMSNRMFVDIISLTLSRRRPLSYRNQSIDLRSNSMDWLLYDNGLRLERVKCVSWFYFIDERDMFCWSLFELLLLIFCSFSFILSLLFHFGPIWMSKRMYLTQEFVVFKKW